MMANENNIQRVRALQSKLNQEMLPHDLRQNQGSSIFLTEKGEPRTEFDLPPSQNFVIATDGTNTTQGSPTVEEDPSTPEDKIDIRLTSCCYFFESFL